MKEQKLVLTIAKQIAESPLKGWFIHSSEASCSVNCISFLQYMSACLYDSEHGYYRGGPIRVGKKGDFYTSSSIGRVLGEILGGYFAAYAKAAGKPLKLIEWGAGIGRLSAQITASGRSRYKAWDSIMSTILVEDHPLHVRAALEAFEEVGGNESAPLLSTSNEAWGSDWLKQPAIVLANELLDAFPVHRVQMANGKLVELGVAWDAVQGFYEVFMPLTDVRISGWLERDCVQLREGQRTEVHAGAVDFLKRLGSAMTEGMLVIIDYGHESEEYTAEHRMLGTLMCYWQHQASDSPYVRVGEQDITSHLPFTFIRRSAEEHGWRTVSYCTQKQFLMENGVLELLQNHQSTDPFSETARMNRAVRQLLLSDEMSETFKVLVLEKKNPDTEKGVSL
ncbi:SAM-dependent MidA family methyltransferase [Paenibacillus castaneae]|uniref:class I SAM-dependent methyltransferase n=1 Tax=Paenibacillus castaneae TaxID=474957 RepID=UPI00141B52E3|nr:SAM-dependent methyltransferase [Paenibacillus castaneae]NIK75884.1 SAM-dependent MidA family methyltransferase [Paenibacillus castaneae]